MSDDHAERVHARLTSRDRLILTLLAEHRFLTTSQIATIAFTNLTTCRHRLARLAAPDLALIRGFQPVIRDDGAHDEAHWVLDHAGAYVVFVMERGLDPSEVPWRKEPSVALIGSAQRRHLRGCNGIMAALLGHGRRTPDTELALWWSEVRFAAWYDRVTRRGNAAHAAWASPWRPCRPDAYAVWREDQATLPFALEYDRGTESLDRLRAKLPGYTDLAMLFGRPVWVLIATTGPRRARHIHETLAGAKVPVATAVFPERDTPQPWAPVWYPAEASQPVRLVDLASTPWPAPVRELARASADADRRAEDSRTADFVRFNEPIPDPCNPSRPGLRDTLPPW